MIRLDLQQPRVLSAAVGLVIVAAITPHGSRAFALLAGIALYRAFWPIGIEWRRGRVTGHVESRSPVFAVRALVLSWRRARPVRVVLWGGSHPRDVQAGSEADARRQELAAAYRRAQRVAAQRQRAALKALSTTGVSAVDAARRLRALGLALTPQRRKR